MDNGFETENIQSHRRTRKTSLASLLFPLLQLEEFSKKYMYVEGYFVVGRMGGRRSQIRDGRRRKETIFHFLPTYTYSILLSRI